MSTPARILSDQTNGAFGTAHGIRHFSNDPTNKRAYGAANYGATHILGLWTPNKIDTLAWWDMSDTDSVLNTGGAVYEVLEQKGGESLLQTNGSRQPTTNQDKIANMNVVTFDGIEDFLDYNTDIHPASGNIAWHILISIDSVTDSRNPIISVRGEGFEIRANNATQFNGELNDAGIGVGTLFTGGPYSGVNIFSLVMDFDNNNYFGYMNGALVCDGTGDYTTKVDNAGDKTRIMCARILGNCLGGKIGEIIVTDDITTDTTNSSIGYLAHRWNATAKLDSGFIYKNRVPIDES